MRLVLYMGSKYVRASYQISSAEQNLCLFPGARVLSDLRGAALPHGVQHLSLTPGGPRTGRGSSERSDLRGA